MKKTRFSATEVKSRLHETAYLNPELTILFEDRRGDETEAEEYHEPEGIVGYLRDLNHKSEVLHEPVLLKGEADGIQVEAAFQYTNEFRENVLGFCNNIYNAEGGTHLTGFKTTFTTVMNTYAREIGVLKDKDANFTGADIRNGMTAVVSIKHPAPRFEGQTKTKLDNQDAAKATGKVLGEQLVLFFDRNLETLKAVLPVRKRLQRSVKLRSGQRPIFLQSRNIPLIPMESLPTVRKRIHLSARFLLWREILQVDLQRQPATGIISHSSHQRKNPECRKSHH